MSIVPQVVPANGVYTATGKFFDFDNPDDNIYSVSDVAHALSHICRFTGHTKTFYSVAQHCVMASFIVPTHLRLAALLHDAAEAFIGDVSSPLKAMLPDYKVIEARVERAIFKRFGVYDMPYYKAVKDADMIMLATERRDLMPYIAEEWDCLRGVEPLTECIHPWTPAKAYLAFMQRYSALLRSGY